MNKRIKKKKHKQDIKDNTYTGPNIDGKDIKLFKVLSGKVDNRLPSFLDTEFE